MTGCTVATPSLTTKTNEPVWLSWTAVGGTTTASSSRNVSSTRTSVPGQSSPSAFGMVARTVTVPVAGSIVFSIIETWPLPRRVSPGMIAWMVAVSAASASRNAGRLFCGSANAT